MDIADLHVQFMRETNEGLDNIDKSAELVLAPAATRLRQQIHRVKEMTICSTATSRSNSRAVMPFVSASREYQRS
jgi:hypothetical protein